MNKKSILKKYVGKGGPDLSSLKNSFVPTAPPTSAMGKFAPAVAGIKSAVGDTLSNLGNAMGKGINTIGKSVGNSLSDQKKNILQTNLKKIDKIDPLPAKQLPSMLPKITKETGNKILPKYSNPISQRDQMERNLDANRKAGKFSNGIGVGGN